MCTSPRPIELLNMRLRKRECRRGTLNPAGAAPNHFPRGAHTGLASLKGSTQLSSNSRRHDHSNHTVHMLSVADFVKFGEKLQIGANFLLTVTLRLYSRGLQCLGRRPGGCFGNG
jgi:hypothetical protein